MGASLEGTQLVTPIDARMEEKTEEVNEVEKEVATRPEKEEVKIFDELRLRIQFLLSIFFLDLHPSTALWRRCVTLTLFTVAIVINFYYALFFIYTTISNLSAISIYSLNAFIQVIFGLMSGSAVFFLFITQRSNALVDFTDKLSEASGLLQSPRRITYLRRLTLIFSILVLLNIIYGVLFSVSYAVGIRPKSITNPKYAVRITELFGDESLYTIYLVAIIYLFVGWNISIMLFVLCTMASKCVIEELHEEIERIDGASLDSLTSSISRVINKHSLIADAVRSFNDNVKQYAFIQLAMSVPCTLCTLFMAISQKGEPLQDILLVTPSLAVALYGFLSISYFPAELHETASKTRAIFCGNLRVWLPYREKAYSLALLFLSYIDHAELGVSAWGFATLSRPAILTTLSVMVTLLALLFQIRGCAPTPR